MESADIWFELGLTCNEMGLLDKAAEAYLKAIGLKMQSALLYNNLAEIYIQKGNFSGALTLYQKSLELFTNPKDLAASWGKIGNVYNRLNEHGKAIQAFQKADEINPTTPAELNPPSDNVEEDGFDAQFQIQEDVSAVISLTNDESEGFESEDEVAGEGFSDTSAGKENQAVQESANVWNELGLVLFKVGAYDDAIDAYQKAIAINSKVGYLYSNLGQVLSIQGKLVEALQQYEKSIQLLANNKDKSVSWTRIGDIYRQLGKFEHAEPAYLLADVLIQTTSVFNNEYRQVKLETISTNTDPVRGMDEIDELVQSVRNLGIIQPLIVCPGRNEPGKYTLIAGRRRLEAAKLAGLKEIPVIVRIASNQEIFEISLNENIHHVAVTPFELGQAYLKMADDFELSIEEISARVSRSCHSVANTMKMFEPPQPPKPAEEKEVQKIGQAIINRSLAEIRAQNSETPDLFPELELPTQVEDVQFESEFSLDGVDPNLESVPTLWYLESPAEDELAKKDEGTATEPTSLLSRARRMLNNNTQARRKWADSPLRI